MAIDDRPRKKKKKKSNAALWIGLAVGAGVFVVIAVVLVVVLAINRMGNPQDDALAKARAQAALLAAQKPPEPPPAKPAQPNFDKVDIGEKKRDNTNIRLRAERPARLNELAQLKIFYMAYGDGTRPPQNVDDFAKSIARDAPAIKQAIVEKYYVILPNVRSGVIAYERDPDTRSMHGFIDTMGGAREMTTQELVAALKEQGH